MTNWRSCHRTRIVKPITAEMCTCSHSRKWHICRWIHWNRINCSPVDDTHYLISSLIYRVHFVLIFFGDWPVDHHIVLILLLNLLMILLCNWYWLCFRNLSLSKMIEFWFDFDANLFFNFFFFIFRIDVRMLMSSNNMIKYWLNWASKHDK